MDRYLAPASGGGGLDLESHGSCCGTRDPAAADHQRDAEADGAGPQPAGDGAHPQAPPRQRVHRGDRQPALVPGDDRGPLRRRLRARRRALLQPRGAAARDLGRGPQRGRVPRRLVPGDLGRRADRHRPPGDGRFPRIPRRDRDPGDEAGRRHEPVRSRDHRRGRPDPGVPGEAAARPRRSPTSPTAASTCSARRSSTTSPSRAPARPPRRTTHPASPTGRWTSSRPCWRATCPFYSHEIDRYWNDIGNLEELRQGNLDALLGEVAIEPGAPEVGDGVWSAGPARGSGRRAARRSSGRGSSSARAAGSRGPPSSATAAGSAPGPWFGTRSCSRAPRSRPRACWRAASPPAIVACLTLI